MSIRLSEDRERQTESETEEGEILREQRGERQKEGEETHMGCA